MPQEPTSNWLNSLLGGKTEQERFAQGIGRRREKKAIEDIWNQSGIERPSPDNIGMAGTTRFITKGVPDIAARSKATQEFLKRMQSFGPTFENAATLFAERYPRVAAHMDPTVMGERGIKGLTHVGDRSKADYRKTLVEFNPKYKDDIEDTLLHEATHVAQDLGNPRMSNMYYIADKALVPRVGIKAAYDLNPFEESARSVARRKMGAAEKPYSAMQGIRSIVEKLPPGDEARRQLAALILR